MNQTGGGPAGGPDGGPAAGAATAPGPGPGWREYIERFHHARPGITSDTLGTASDGGTDPYLWALEPLDHPPRLVDIACGDGPLHARSPSEGWVGVDASVSELHRARAQGAPRLIRADATRLPIATGSTPAVICSMALMIIQPVDRALAEIRRILTDDGTAVILMPGGRPLTAGDLWRYSRLMITLRRTRLAYPNDRALLRLRAAATAAGLEPVEDRRRRFDLPLPDSGAAERFIASLYLPGIDEARYRHAATRARSWVPSTIGIPLRRITLKARPQPLR